MTLIDDTHDHTLTLPVTAPVRGTPATLVADRVSAWFGDHQVLEDVTLTMPAGRVTALIGPSGCGKSTFLRILNRMHELVPGSGLAGEVRLDGTDIYDVSRRPIESRRRIGMVFQKANPFPTMSINDNVLAGLSLTGQKLRARAADHLVEESLRSAGLWDEVRTRLDDPGASLSGGQQQRLCIARALAVRLGARPHVDPAGRGDDPRHRRRRDRRDRHPQHATGPAGLRPMRVLPGLRGPARPHRRAGRDRGDLRAAGGQPDRRLRERTLRMTVAPRRPAPSPRCGVRHRGGRA
jgi:phosphate transport system ATP-binding protein